MFTPKHIGGECGDYMFDFVQYQIAKSFIKD